MERNIPQNQQTRRRVENMNRMHYEGEYIWTMKNENSSLGDSCSAVDDPPDETMNDDWTRELLGLLRQETHHAGTCVREKAGRRIAETMDFPHQTIQWSQLVSTNSEEVQAISQSLQALKHHDPPLLADAQFTDLAQLYKEVPNASSRARRLLDMSAKLRKLGELVLEKENENEIERTSVTQKIRGDRRTPVQFTGDNGPDPPCHTCYDPPGYEPIMFSSFVDPSVEEEEKSLDDFEVSLATFLQQSSGPFASVFQPKAERPIPPPIAINIDDPPGKEPCAGASIVHTYNLGDSVCFSHHPSIGGVDERCRGSAQFEAEEEEEEHYCYRHDNHHKEIEFPQEEIPNTPVYFSIDPSDGEASVEVVPAESFDDESFHFQRDCGLLPSHSGIRAVFWDGRGRAYDDDDDDDDDDNIINNVAPTFLRGEESANPATDESHTSTTALSSMESDHGHPERDVYRPPMTLTLGLGGQTIPKGLIKASYQPMNVSSIETGRFIQES